MIKIPSYKAAMIFGAIGMPIFILVLKLIEKVPDSQPAQIAWSILGFGVPFLLSTGDFKYIKQERSKGRSFLGPWTRSQDFKEFFIPTWKRMAVWFLSAAISLIMLNIIGFDMS